MKNKYTINEIDLQNGKIVLCTLAVCMQIDVGCGVGFYLALALLIGACQQTTFSRVVKQCIQNQNKLPKHSILWPCLFLKPFPFDYSKLQIFYHFHVVIHTVIYCLPLYITLYPIQKKNTDKHRSIPKETPIVVYNTVSVHNYALLLLYRYYNAQFTTPSC